MDIDDTENPFDTGAVNPGYDETGEMNEMDRFPSSSSRRGSEDTTYHRTRGETSFIEGIDEHTPLIPLKPCRGLVSFCFMYLVLCTKSENK